MSSDLWVITCYFNPCRYKTKRANFDAFMAGMKDNGANVLVVELAFGDEEFELPESKNVLRLRGSGVMWQKERLLNIAARDPAGHRAPRSPGSTMTSCSRTPNWVQETSDALEEFVVVQPFDWAVRLPRGGAQVRWTRRHVRILCQSVRSRTGARARGRVFRARAYRLSRGRRGASFSSIAGFTMPCLTASGDHLMAHGFAGGMKLQPLPHAGDRSPAALCRDISSRGASRRATW